ncbi:MAG: phosphatidate cytidylyltransferase [Acetobacter sp.]|nr:phosphatidate cytidylyltransferase [Bacteroides sp.]MCM1340700.1 phosphatidate cytidylyltransferase [Acetobacter sp.]MCM1433811.1 phosphatidate cytidylyltransferase [Clostridiales bacterium]
MKQRVITAVCLLAVLALVVWQIKTPVLVIVIAFLSAVASNEIMKCANVQNTFIKVAGTAFSAVVPFFASEKVMSPWISQEIWGKVIGTVPNIVFVIVLCLVFLLAMLKGYAYTTFEDVTVSVFASVIVPFGFSIFIRLRDMFDNMQFGVYLIFYALICALATDTGAQLTGMAIGKHKMSPNISPKKTIEGAVGGLIFSFILNAVAITIYNKVAVVPVDKAMFTILLVCCVPVSFMGMMGDLSASVLKRNFDVKDFGKIFPGHGGVMDRMDSSLFTLPCTYAIALITMNVL